MNAEADTSCFKVINIATYWYILVGQPEVWGRAYRALTSLDPEATSVATRSCRPWENQGQRTRSITRCSWHRVASESERRAQLLETSTPSLNRGFCRNRSQLLFCLGGPRLSLLGVLQQAEAEHEKAHGKRSPSCRARSAWSSTKLHLTGQAMLALAWPREKDNPQKKRLQKWHAAFWTESSASKTRLQEESSSHSTSGLLGPQAKTPTSLPLPGEAACWGCQSAKISRTWRHNMIVSHDWTRRHVGDVLASDVCRGYPETLSSLFERKSTPKQCKTLGLAKQKDMASATATAATQPLPETQPCWSVGVVFSPWADVSLCTPCVILIWLNQLKPP